MKIVIYCPDGNARAAICRHIIETGHHRIFPAESMEQTVAMALDNDIKLVLLFDPARIGLMIGLKDYLRSKRRHMRVRILPSHDGNLMEGWRKIVNDALVPVKPRPKTTPTSHPRFHWKPGS